MESLDLNSLNYYKDVKDIKFFYTADFEKAKEIVELQIKNNGDPIEVNYGLDGDWDSNHDLFYCNGVFNDDCIFFNQSYWAKPKLQFIYNDREVVIECYTKTEKS